MRLPARLPVAHRLPDGLQDAAVRDDSRMSFQSHTHTAIHAYRVVNVMKYTENIVARRAVAAQKGSIY